MKNCLKEPPNYGLRSFGLPAPITLSFLEYPEISSTILWKVEALHREHDDRGEIVVAHTREYGKVLFYDGEIQIAECDFDRYHDFVATLAGCPTAKEILIVGDGDGGFTHYPWSDNTTYVEPSTAMMAIGDKYFGAEWRRPKAVYAKTIQDYIEDGWGKRFDTAILAVTDSFSDEDDLCATLKGVSDMTDRMVCTVGTVNDPGYYRNLPKFVEFGRDHSRQFGFYPLFCPSFMSEIVFFAADFDAPTG